MAFLLWLLTALVPYLLGMGALCVLYGRRTAQEMSLADSVLTGGMIVMGLAETAHLTAVVLGWSFSGSANVFAIEILFFSVVAGIVLIFWQKKVQWSGKQRRGERMSLNMGQDIFWLVLGVIVSLQLISVVTMKSIYTVGDMTLESVNSFLISDSIYERNPLTGGAYGTAMPLRLRILCLPSLYGYLCKFFSLESALLVYGIMPAFVLLASYLAYGTLAKYLFPTSSAKRGLFMLMTALLFSLGDYAFGVDGFNVLHSGFRGITIRSAVLLPYTISLMLRKKYKLVVLCILAEGCIVWTLYGMGACFFVAVVLLILQFVRRKYVERSGGEEGALCRNS